MEPLDNYSKILLATQTINHMGHIISSSNEVIRHSLRPEFNETAKKVTIEGRETTDAFLSTIAHKLRDIVEELGNFCDGRDIATEGYENLILKVAFDVLYERDEDIIKNYPIPENLN